MMQAKPFIHRLPIGPVPTVKNGFRLASPPASVYDPNTAAAAAVAYSAAPQRFVYAANGAALTQPPVPYNGQVHLFVSRILSIILQYNVVNL